MRWHFSVNKSAALFWLLQSVSLDIELILVSVVTQNEFVWTVWLLTNDFFHILGGILIYQFLSISDWLKFRAYGCKQPKKRHYTDHRPTHMVPCLTLVNVYVDLLIFTRIARTS